ncbi:hypothetical protein BAU22_24900 [Bacillus sp. 4048]|nr:hypothetical protein TU50_26420 [Bacillus wiedmannii]OJD40087.1 hypothetical protein BAU22_24900 [Bacillus sp. 4048]TXR64423.1 hypothetical protein DM800_14480 [Bacillus sp. AY18-3]
MYQTSRYIRCRVYTIAINYWNFWHTPKRILAKVHEGTHSLGKGQFLLLEIADLVKPRYLVQAYGKKSSKMTLELCII